MLILCCGPDSYRALARAKELELAFKQKHDPEGRAIERLSSGKDGVEELISKAAGASLFSPRRFLRVDGIVSSCPKTKQKALLEALARDTDAMIVVSVEEERPVSSVMKPFEALPKIVVNDYPLLSGRSFTDWAREIAKTLGNIDDNQVVKLADFCEGDSWKFINEAIKLAAGASLELDRSSSEASAYDLADQILKKDLRRRGNAEKIEFSYAETSVLVQQGVAALRVKDQDVAGLPPFVLKKLQSMNMIEPSLIFASSLEMLFLQRAGFCNEAESISLIP
ncbi:hypothetical protein IPH19_03315 [Candidatus Uhrbacteria bacterium]|nr:MAG: hypothetical protein IPH19_03315 [Candidatus Uhrbacteria bacterium]